MNRHIVFQAYGNIAIIHELRYCIHSLYKLYNGAVPCAITVYTDQPEALQRVLPAEIQYELLTPDMLATWAGSPRFVHRVKVEMLRHFSARNTGTVLYLDTDTIFVQKPDSLFEAAEQGKYVMHLNEGKIADRGNLLFTKMDKFLNNNSQIGVPREVSVWNAGVLGFPAADTALLNNVLQLTDTLYGAYQKHIMEQLAFSYCMQTTKPLQAAEDEIFHYWNFKEFRAVLAEFFQAYESRPFTEITGKMQRIDPRELIQPKLAFERKPSLVRKIQSLFGSTWQMPPWRE